MHYTNGENFIDEGTIKQLSENLGLSMTTLYSLKCPSYLNRSTNNDRKILIKIEEPKPKIKIKKKKIPKPRYIKKPPKIYNLYKLGILIATGTKQELAEKVNLKEKTIAYYSKESYKKKFPYTKYRVEEVKK